VDADTIHLTLADVSPVDLHLTDTGAPLLGGQWVRGTQTATYSWSEVGSGIRMEWIDIDGARRFTIDHAGECDIGWSGASGEFARQFSPCIEAAGIGRSYGFDTASLPDGAHRGGGDRVVEAYPAAALLLWELPREGYKSDPAARENLLAALEERAPWLAWEPGARKACIESDDSLDAVLCALIARAAALGLTEPPPPEDRDLARAEGWIHLPREGSLGELAVDHRW